ncbi:hypothetical protein NLJ89_g1096 [Agrocybe chaxingu]|uniref:C2H2-type domain-containing protein n=1 Tax=Agrocybe chaxingu TaxID=84603 RepID=A0A9W8N0T2_9AGAR|nr:hypothetical protein NLJ89_g1096 [Agrocybe chaxingu]
MVWESLFDVLNKEKDDACDTSSPATPPRPTSLQPRAALWNPLEGDTSGTSAFQPQSPLGSLDLNGILNTYFKIPEDDHEKEKGKENESHPFITCNPLSPSAAPPTTRTIYSPDIDAPDEEDTRARRGDKGKGRAIEETSGWEADFEAGDILDDGQNLGVNPREVFGSLDEELYAYADADEEDLEEDASSDTEEDGDDDEYVENHHGRESPVAGPSTGAGNYYGAGPIASAPVAWVAWGTLQRHESQVYMNGVGSALATEQLPQRHPSSSRVKCKRDADDDGSDHAEGTPHSRGSAARDVPGPEQPREPTDTRMSEAEILETYGGSRHPEPTWTTPDYGCRVWGKHQAWCCHFCEKTLKLCGSINRHVKSTHYAPQLWCKSSGCPCTRGGGGLKTSRKWVMTRHLKTYMGNSRGDNAEGPELEESEMDESELQELEPEEQKKKSKKAR